MTSTPTPTRRRRVLALVGAAVAAVGLVGVAAYAARPGASDQPPRTQDDLRLDWQARSGGAQVLGGNRTPGTPSVQRFRHDDVLFTVTVAPARPGPNLVRVDSAGIREGAVVPHGGHGGRGRAVYVGTRAAFDAGEQVRASERPGASGLWAVVDLPEGTGTLLVSHGPRHRVPFAVDTGSDEAPAAWTGVDGPECLTAATAAVLAGGPVAGSCPADALTQADADAVAATVETLAGRGLEELAIGHDSSPRSTAAYDVAVDAAEQHGLRVVDETAPPGERNALLELGGWESAATSLADVTALPLRQQPIRSDGTWLAPWLLSPGVVDSTAGAVLPLDFDIRDPRAQEFSQTLATLFPGQTPTSSGYLAWRAARGGDPGGLRLYAASRAAYMPKEPGHASHGSEVAWFPGGTVTPVGDLG